MRDKNVLITGGAGFIGSHLAEKLSHDNKVSIIDNFSRGKKSDISNINCSIINIDLANQEIPKSTIETTDIVFHLASSVGSYKFYEDNALGVLKTNTNIDWNVFNSFESKPVKMFYASSSHVYPVFLQNKIDSPPLSEEDAFPCDPSLSYGWNKISSEKYLSYYNGPMKIAIGRYNGIYGPRQSVDLKRGSIIPVLIERASRYPEEDYKIISKGEEERSFCYIDDAIEATINMINALEFKDFIGPLNIGKQEKISIKDLALLIKDIINPSMEFKIDDQSAPNIMCQWCDCSKIKKEINWEAKIDLKEGIKKIIQSGEKRQNEKNSC
jgi:nucleoside-diphosphate-sugar epimerase